MAKKPTKVGPIGLRGGADMSRTETAIARESEIGGNADAPKPDRNASLAQSPRRPSQKSNRSVKK
jgi:hypothetical protein